MIFKDRVGECGFDVVYYWNVDFIKLAAAEANDVKVILNARDSLNKWDESLIWFKKVQDMVLTVLSLYQTVQGNYVEALEKSYIHHEQLVRELVPLNELYLFSMPKMAGAHNVIS